MCIYDKFMNEVSNYLEQPLYLHTEIIGNNSHLSAQSQLTFHFDFVCSLLTRLSFYMKSAENAS